MEDVKKYRASELPMSDSYVHWRSVIHRRRKKFALKGRMKGKIVEDSGFFYCPYIPKGLVLGSSQKITDE